MKSLEFLEIMMDHYLKKSSFFIYSSSSCCFNFYDQNGKFLNSFTQEQILYKQRYFCNGQCFINKNNLSEIDEFIFRDILDPKYSKKIRPTSIVIKKFNDGYRLYFTFGCIETVEGIKEMELTKYNLLTLFYIGNPTLKDVLAFLKNDPNNRLDIPWLEKNQIYLFQSNNCCQIL